MKFFLGRQVVMTELEDIPRGHRALPGCIALNSREVKAIERNAEDDNKIVKQLIEFALAETAADARLTMVTPRKRRRRLGPATRMAMLRTFNPGRPS